VKRTGGEREFVENFKDNPEYKRKVSMKKIDRSGFELQIF
jgi:hypothetical protein